MRLPGHLKSMRAARARPGRSQGAPVSLSGRRRQKTGSHLSRGVSPGTPPGLGSGGSPCDVSELRLGNAAGAERSDSSHDQELGACTKSKPDLELNQELDLGHNLRLTNVLPISIRNLHPSGHH